METFPVTSNSPNAGNGSLGAAMGNAATKAHGAVDHASASANEAAGAVKPAIARAAQIAHQAVDSVSEVATPTAAWLTARGEALAAAQRNAVSDAKTYISANPWQSIGMALAAGVLIGRLAR